MMFAGVMLAAATLVSEDAATLTAGALVATQVVSPAVAIGAVAAGIWIGDLALFGLGRLARRTTMAQRFVDRRWTAQQVNSIAARVNGGAVAAILGSRFMPGTRVLVYVAAGLLQVRLLTFAVVAALAALMWTTAIVITVGSMGALR